MRRYINHVRLCSILLALSGGLFIILSTATHHWCMSKSAQNGTSLIGLKHQGLWEQCYEVNRLFICRPLKSAELSDWLNAVKAFMILSIILYILVIIYLVVMVWGRGMTVRLIGIDLLLAATFSLIAVSIYTGKYKLGPGYKYGWSYALGWTGTIFTVLSGILCFFSDVDYVSMD